jgi:hypothetical protein
VRTLRASQFHDDPRAAIRRHVAPLNSLDFPKLITHYRLMVKACGCRGGVRGIKSRDGRACFYCDDSFVSAVFVAFASAVVPFYAVMFEVCGRGHTKARSFERLFARDVAHSPLQSVLQRGSRPGSVVGGVPRKR